MLKVDYSSTNKEREGFWLPEVRSGERGELDEGGQKVQTSSYKINLSTRDVMYNIM